jgi:hypothetical protein
MFAMKKVSSFLGLLFFIGICCNASAQVGQKIEKGVKSAGKAVGKAGKTVGQNTAEVASKGKSTVVDRKYEGKTGPQGQTIYIDKNDNTYWVDDKGHKNYIPKSQVR